MSTGVACANCSRFDRRKKDREECDAFPHGIPMDILSGKNSHRQSVRGDQGLTWLPIVGLEFLDVSEAVTIDEGDDADVSIFHQAGKHDQKRHGRKGSRGRAKAKEVDYNEFSRSHVSDGYSKAGVSEQEKLGAAQAALPFSRETSQEMDARFGEAARRQGVVNAVSNYGASGYIAINSGLRGKAPSSEIKEKVADIDKAFDEVPSLKSAITVHRASRSDRFSSLKAGDEIQDLGYVSTSASAKEAEKFGNVRFRIKVPKGTKALPTASVTGESFEKEIILPRGTKFKVTKTSLIGETKPGALNIIGETLGKNIVIIDVEVVK